MNNGYNYDGSEYNNVTSLDNNIGYGDNEYNNVTSLDNNAGYNQNQSNMYAGNEYNNVTGSNDGIFQSPTTLQQQQIYTKPRGNCILWIILGVIQLCLSGFCVWTIITGILTIVFAISAQVAKSLLQVIKLQNRLRLARIVNIIGWIIMIVSLIMDKVQ